MARPRLQELSPTECRSLLHSARFGRLVFTERAMPAVHPVNFMLAGNDIVIRTGPGAKFDAARRGDVVAFEADDVDSETRTGWSVLVVGRASLVTDIDELVALAEPAYRPWVYGRREHLVRIAGEQVTGRRLSLGSPTAPAE